MQRVVRCGEREVCEKWFSVATAVIDELDQSVRIVFRGIKITRQINNRLPVAHVARRATWNQSCLIGPMTRASVQKCERLLKASRTGHISTLAQVPLSGHKRVMARVPQQLRHGYDVVPQVPLISGLTPLVLRCDLRVAGQADS